MGQNSMPKTFILSTVGKNGKDSFIRFISVQDSNGNITYRLTLTNKKSEASKFINIDNSKKISAEILEEYKLKSIRIIDTSNGKSHDVKKQKKQK